MDEITTMLAQVINELKSKMGDQYEIEATAKDTVTEHFTWACFQSY